MPGDEAPPKGASRTSHVNQEHRRYDGLGKTKRGMGLAEFRRALAGSIWPALAGSSTPSHANPLTSSGHALSSSRSGASHGPLIGSGWTDFFADKPAKSAPGEGLVRLRPSGFGRGVPANALDAV